MVAAVFWPVNTAPDPELNNKHHADVKLRKVIRKTNKYSAIRHSVYIQALSLL